LLEIKDILLKEESTGGVIPPGTISEKETRELFESQFSDFLSIEDKVEGLDYKLSKCCNPVPGDSIFGFVTISEGIKIHRTACPNAHNMLARYPYRVISARWTKSKSGTSFIATIKVTGVEDIGIVNKISEVITGFNATVRSFNYNMEEGMFEGTINLLVANNDMLYGIIRKIHSIKGILKVNRQNN